jgi:hypothetical protein
MALERPLWRFAHPHFFAPVKPLRGFPVRAQKNVSYLLSLNDSCRYTIETNTALQIKVVYFEAIYTKCLTAQYEYIKEF